MAVTPPTYDAIMRLLHTGDWHLGRSLGDHRLLGDQRRLLEWLVEVVTDADIDLVVVAGDVYDRAVPPVEAVDLLRDAVLALRGAGAEVVIVAGNHDGPDRLAPYGSLTDGAGVVVRGGYGRPGEVLVRHYRDEVVALVPVPFLDPLLAPPRFLAETAAAPGSDRGSAESSDRDDGRRSAARPTHHQVLHAWLHQARCCLPPGIPSIVVAHAFVAGGAPSPSERELTVGTSGRVAATCFAGYDYVALGHLHRPQTVAGQPNVRYAGAPLAYSFGESGGKQVVVVDVDGPGAVRVEALPVPVGRPVATLRGRFADLLSDPSLERHRDAWVRAELTDVAPVLDAQRRLRERFPLLAEVARVQVGGTGARVVPAAELRSRDPLSLARDFWHDVVGEGPEPEVEALLAAALAEVAAPAEGVDR